VVYCQDFDGGPAHHTPQPEHLVPHIFKISAATFISTPPLLAKDFANAAITRYPNSF